MLLKGFEYENPLEYNKYSSMFFSLAYDEDRITSVQDRNVFLTVGNVLKDLKSHSDLMVLLQGLLDLWLVSHLCIFTDKSLTTQTVWSFKVAKNRLNFV